MEVCPRGQTVEILSRERTLPGPPRPAGGPYYGSQSTSQRLCRVGEACWF